MNEVVLGRILAEYGLSHKTILPPQKGYRNTSHAVILADGRCVNFILYKNEPDILSRIRRTNLVTSALHQGGLPVRYPLDGKIVKLQQAEKTLYGALYNYLPGKTLPWEGYAKAHIKLAGMAMSTMHHQLRDIDHVETRVIDEYEAILKRMQAYFLNDDVVRAMNQKLKLATVISFPRLHGLLGVTGSLPGQQVLHMDFVRGNLLFKTAEPSDLFQVGSYALSGIIDFEKVACGHPMLDIARTLAFLFVDCSSKTPDQIMKYFLQSGYNKRGGAVFSNSIITYRESKINLLDEMVSLFLLYDFYKFLRHNPYESLKDNHHFIRTRDILISRKMLQFS